MKKPITNLSQKHEDLLSFESNSFYEDQLFSGTRTDENLKLIDTEFTDCIFENCKFFKITFLGCRFENCEFEK